MYLGLFPETVGLLRKVNFNCVVPRRSDVVTLGNPSSMNHFEFFVFVFEKIKEKARGYNPPILCLLNNANWSVPAILLLNDNLPAYTLSVGSALRRSTPI